MVLILSVINLCGNSLNLAAVRTTPRLQTKSNYILSWLMVADMLVAIELIENAAVNAYIAYNGGLCKHIS